MKENEIRNDRLLSKKVKKTITIFCFIGVICSSFLFIPYLQEQIIFCAEKILHKELINHQKRIQQIVQAALISLSYIIFTFLIIKIHSEKYDRVLKAFLVCVFMMSQLLIRMKLGAINEGGYIQTSYLVSYRYGFASRMFIGTVVDLLSGGGFVSKDFLNAFVFYAMILFCFAIGLAFYFLIQKANGKTKLPVMVFFILYVCSPISPLVYFTTEFSGRMEVYVLPFMLVIFYLIDKDKWCFLIPLLCFISIATHLVVLFFYMPVVLLVLLYKIFSDSPPKQNAKYVFLITALVIAAASAYFILFSRTVLIFQTEGEFISILQSRTDIPLTEGGVSLHYDYFLSIGETLKYVIDSMDGYKENGIYSGFYAILQTIPLFFFFIFFWISCIKKESRNHIRILFSCSALLPVLSTPAFILFLDYGRWLTMLFTAQFMLVFYFLHKQENSVILTAQKMVTIIKNNPYAALSLILVSLCMGYLGCISPSENFQLVLSLIARVLKKL